MVEISFLPNKDGIAYQDCKAKREKLLAAHWYADSACIYTCGHPITDLDEWEYQVGLKVCDCKKRKDQKCCQSLKDLPSPPTNLKKKTRLEVIHAAKEACQFCLPDADFAWRFINLLKRFDSEDESVDGVNGCIAKANKDEIYKAWVRFKQDFRTDSEARARLSFLQDVIGILHRGTGGHHNKSEETGRTAQINDLPPKGTDPTWTWEYGVDENESWYPPPGFTGEERAERTKKWKGA